MANLKNITELPVAESAEGLNLIVNDNGVAKQIAADSVGKVKTVNGTEPDEHGNVEVEIPEGFSGSWNDLSDKPFYTETDADGNETVHKIDAKYLPDYDLVIEGTYVNNDLKWILKKGSYEAIYQKLANKEIITAEAYTASDLSYIRNPLLSAYYDDEYGQIRFDFHSVVNNKLYAFYIATGMIIGEELHMSEYSV